MKSVVTLFLALTILIGAAISSIPAAPAAPASTTSAKSEGVTIGDFAVAVAKTMESSPETRASMSPEAALASLKRSGWSFSSGPDGVLTQGELASFLRQAGIQVSVSSANQPVSAEQARSAISGFGSLFASRSSSKPVPPPSSLSSTHQPGTESFADCAALPKVPDCRVCCTNLGLSFQACGKACGRAHAALQVSASEPTP